MPQTFTQDIAKLKKFFQGAPEQIARRATGPATLAATRAAVRRARALAPARTGLLRSTIRAFPADAKMAVGLGGKKKIRRSAAALWAGAPADYALFVERGTRHQPAQEPLTRALRQARSSSMFSAFVTALRANNPREWR